MNLLLRAIITGFGYKIGAELGKRVAEWIGLKDRESTPAEADLPEGLPKTPPGGDEDGGDAPPPDDEESEDDDGHSDAA